MGGNVTENDDGPLHGLLLGNSGPSARRMRLSVGWLVNWVSGWAGTFGGSWRACCSCRGDLEPLPVCFQGIEQQAAVFAGEIATDPVLMPMAVLLGRARVGAERHPGGGTGCRHLL
ncbi:hypothetical protein D3C85_1570630 [compost metagenome]